jgi:hypothetical protein
METFLITVVIVVVAIIFLQKGRRQSSKQYFSSPNQNQRDTHYNESSMNNGLLATGIGAGAGLLGAHVAGSYEDSHDDDDCPSINPATGLPMLNCTVDIEGNAYGMDNNDSAFDHNTWDDDVSSSFSDD